MKMKGMRRGPALAVSLASVLITLGTFFAAGRDATVRELALNVISFNIRYDNPDDGPNAWPNRKSLAASVFRDWRVDIAGLQEALIGQIRDLEAALPEFAWAGVGRDDGREKGEFSPIFYDRNKLSLSDHGTFWLSETPEVPGSVHWDNAITRIATYGIFRHKETGLSIFVLNTHLDHVGENSRQRSAELIASRIKALSRGLPVILTGDLNSSPDSPALTILTSDKEIKLTNSRELAEEPHFGAGTTFNGFGRADHPETIDFVLVSLNFRVKRHGHLQVRRGDVYISDHFPVFARVILRRHAPS
jgi:endonuclease/exonuclease/phosphatase family metal-dependent hydrolase